VLATVINVIAIILGTALGCLLHNGLPENMKKTIMQGFGLTVLIIGISMAIKTQNALIIALSVASGAVVGELLRIEYWLDQMGQKIEARFGGGDGLFSKGFVTASLVYCVGAMSIMGALDAGLNGSYNTLFIKSLLDGVSSIVFASTMGFGVAFAAIPVFIYQGAITLAAGLVKPLLTAAIIREMTATGGVLILGIGLNILNDRLKIRVGNLLPAILMAILFTLIFAHFSL
jgi:uncharacterized membrane protein YqgA involved in biofilm formation